MNIANPKASDVIQQLGIRRGNKNISRSLTKKNGKSIGTLNGVQQVERAACLVASPFKKETGRGEGLLGYVTCRFRIPHLNPLPFSNGRGEKY
jgi:hypothetical protein